MAGMFEFSSSSTAVDLSRLPPPTIVETLSFETILAELVADLQARLPAFDALVESEPVMKLLEAFAYRELLQRQKFNDRARGLMLAYAAGADLDQLAALIGVTRKVIVPADPANGVEEVLESDSAFRARIVLAPESFSVAGPALAYVYHALSAHADVLDASAVSPVPGEVVVTILARNGNGAAPAAVIDAVEAVVNGLPVRPLTDLVTVQSAQIIEFAVEAQLYLFDGPSSDVVIAEARSRLEAYLDLARRVGRDVTRSGITAALHAEGVQRVNLISPAADVAVDSSQAGYCTGIVLGFAGHAY